MRREWSDDDGETQLNLAEAEAEIPRRKRRNPAQFSFAGESAVGPYRVTGAWRDM